MRVRAAEDGCPLASDSSALAWRRRRYTGRSEVDGYAAVGGSRPKAGRLALPVINGPAPLLFREWTFGAPLETGPFGIPAPAEGVLAAPDVMFVPLLAFDRRGYRLGYGGGHYDRTLAALRRNGGVAAIGLAFDAQEVAEVPVCPYVALDGFSRLAQKRQGHHYAILFSSSVAFRRKPYA